MSDTLPGDFYRAVVDTLGPSLCAIDRHGNIVFVNRSWSEFGRCNGASDEVAEHPGNYLQICERAARQGSEQAGKVAIGLRALINGEIPEFSYEYPCHSPQEQRWFILNARRLAWSRRRLYMLKHTNITARKLAELEVQKLSLTDRLTGLANRRHFDEFLEREWAVHRREHLPLALILLDLDHFKRLNDEYGHLAGDASLARVAGVLTGHARRAADLAARYGGEEMALILCRTGLNRAGQLAEIIRADVCALNIRHESSPIAPHLTASLGVASMVPGRDAATTRLVEAADEALYRAKHAGRNRVARADEVAQTA